MYAYMHSSKIPHVLQVESATTKEESLLKAHNIMCVADLKNALMAERSTLAGDREKPLRATLGAADCVTPYFS